MNYHDRPELSFSSLKNILKSPAYFKYRQDNKIETSDAMKLGSACHCAILEQDKFKEQYVCAPKVDKRTKEGKATFEAFQIANKGKEVLSEDEFNQVLDVQKSVLSSPKIADMLKKGESEKEFFFELEGIKFKSKLDFLTERFILDLKTTRDCTARSFANDFFKMHYDMQAYIYTQAVLQTTGEALPYICMAVEKTDNCEFQVYHIDEEWIKKGEIKFKKSIELYKQCLEKNEWPSMSHEVQTLLIPKWSDYE